MERKRERKREREREREGSRKWQKIPGPRDTVNCENDGNQKQEKQRGEKQRDAGRWLRHCITIPGGLFESINGLKGGGGEERGERE